MASGYRNVAGVDTDDLYDPDTVGDGPTAPGFRRADGSLLKYAAAKYGTPGAAISDRLVTAVDIGPQWARKGTASYTLPINGQSYSSASGRGTGQLTLTLASDGSYSIVSVINGSGGGNVLASGTWLPAGDSAANFSCDFSFVQNTNVTASGGTNTNTNGAPAASALSTTRTFVSQSSSPLVNQFAHQELTLTIRIYRAGTLMSTTHVDFTTSGDGQ